MAKKKKGKGEAEAERPAPPASEESDLAEPAASESRLAEALAADTTVESEQAVAPEAEFLCVRVQSRRYALPVRQVAEVVLPGPVTEVPHVPGYIRGVFNRHGHISTLLDLAIYAGTDVEESPKRVVVLESGPLEAAVPVSEIIGLVSMPINEINEPLPHVAHESGFVTGQFALGDEIYSVVDADVLLASSRHRAPGAA